MYIGYGFADLTAFNESVLTVRVFENDPSDGSNVLIDESSIYRDRQTE